jgi:hypothetical protein
MSVRMTALDGSNPLAFLAAIGAFRLMQPDQNGVKLRWRRDGFWQPELVGVDGNDALSEILVRRAKSELPFGPFQLLGKNITVDRQTFHEFVTMAYEASKHGDRTAADFATAFGSEALEQKGKERIEYTDFCFITGSGHQHFLGTMEGLAQNVSAEHIQNALFGDWKKNKGLSMRWDPDDAAEYAFRWGDPSAEGASAVWGANLLAVHGLPLLPAQPTTDGLWTTGFRYSRGAWPEFTWPIWPEAIGLDTLRSLLALPDLQAPEDKLNREVLRGRGIAEIYRSPRVRIGQGANFKVSFRQARAV